MSINQMNLLLQRFPLIYIWNLSGSWQAWQVSKVPHFVRSSSHAHSAYGKQSCHGDKIISIQGRGQRAKDRVLINI